MENLVVLFLLVQHVLLLRLLQRPLIHVPPVHLLQLLTLLRGMQHTNGMTSPSTCPSSHPAGFRGGETTGQKSRSTALAAKWWGQASSLRQWGKWVSVVLSGGLLVSFNCKNKAPVTWRQHPVLPLHGRLKCLSGPEQLRETGDRTPTNFRRSTWHIMSQPKHARWLSSKHHGVLERSHVNIQDQEISRQLQLSLQQDFRAVQ